MCVFCSKDWLVKKCDKRTGLCIFIDLYYRYVQFKVFDSLCQ